MFQVNPLLGRQVVQGQAKSQGEKYFFKIRELAGNLKFVRELWYLSKSQGKVKDF